MLEYPEIKTIVSQMQTGLIGKTVASGALRKKNNNMFMNEGHVAEYGLLNGGTVTRIECLPPEIYIMLDNGYGILFCQCGGKILLNESGAPENFNIVFNFTDGGSLTYTMMLFTLGVFAASHGEWQTRVRENQKFDPLGSHSFKDYMAFINNRPEGETKKPIKTFIATNISGVMSTFAAEILLYAGIYPSAQARVLGEEQHERIYDAMKSVLTDACEKGGRVSEFDLHGHKGKYVAMAERKHIGEQCPVCGGELGKVSVGGVTAFCPNCQRKK